MRRFFPRRARTVEAATVNQKAFPFNERCTPVPRGHLPGDSGHKERVTSMTTLVKRVGGGRGGHPVFPGGKCAVAADDLRFQEPLVRSARCTARVERRGYAHIRPRASS
jgi:hypothetical protein